MSSLRSDTVDVVFWLPAINPYWALRLCALEKSGRISFECWFNAERGAGREWVVSSGELSFPHEFLPTNTLKRYLRLAVLYRRARPQRILTFHFDPALWPSLLHAVVARRRLAFYAEKTWDSWVRRTRLKEVVKRVVFGMCDDIFTPGPDAVEYLKQYAPRANFRRLPHVVDVPHLARARHEGSVGEPFTFLYLGRFIEEKGLFDLMNAFDICSTRGMSFKLICVGSGPMSGVITDWASRARFKVSVEDFVQARGLPEVFARADALVFPTHGDPYGLVVDEALAAGLPVVSSLAAGEITDRLVDGGLGPRGLLFKTGDVEELAEKLAFISERPKEYHELARNASAYADANSGVDNWVCAMEAWCSES